MIGRWRGRLLATALLAAPGAAVVALPRQAAPDTAWPVRFVDIATQAGLTEPITYGDPQRKRFIIETNGCGVALIDLDGDGRPELLTLNGTRLEPGTRRDQAWKPGEAPVIRLHRNQGAGRFVDVSAGSGLQKVGWASSVCAGDVDGDGLVDLFITYFGRNVLYRNLGQGRFADITAKAGLAAARDRWGSGCTFLDIDRDGDLDLFVANYLSLDLASTAEPGQGGNCYWKGVPVNCGPKGLRTDTNLLYRNDGGVFTDVSDASGIARVTGRYSMTAAAADLDGDGWIDIYVATDSTAAILYRNNHDGTFTDIALQSGAAYNELGSPQAGMGLALGDYDADGALDILKTHFADDIPALYRQRGRGLFEDVATQTGLAVQNRYVQWGAGMPDLDNDGWMDVFYVTGNVYPEVEAAMPQYPHRSPRIVFRNQGGRFADVTTMSGAGVTTPQSSRGAAFGDIDADGDVDVLVMNMNAPPSLLRNDETSGGHWLTIRLDGVRSNRQGVGATVLVTSGGRTQARAVLSQTSYYSVDDLRPSFGLGEARVADRVEVRWPSGVVDIATSVAADRVFTVRESSR